MQQPGALTASRPGWRLSRPGDNGHPATAAPSGLPAAQQGEPAPPFGLPDLAGRHVDLAEFRGNDTLLRFWNPGCGFCQQMLPDLKAWELSRGPGQSALVVVSTGTVEANQAMGLCSPVLLDDRFAVGPRFGVHGTPSAVTVDSQGKIASAVAVGAVEVLQLASRPAVIT